VLPTNLIAVDPDTGSVKWEKHHTSVWYVYTSPTVDSRGTIYISDDYSTYAINPADGSLRWKTHPGDNTGSEYSSVVIGPDGTLYIGSEDMDRVYALEEGNTPPVAQLTISPAELDIGTTITLDGSDSSDPDPDDEVKNFHWALVEKPSESEAEITGTSEAIATLVPDLPGSYHITLRVTDGYGLEDEAEGQISVSLGSPNPPESVEASDGTYDNHVRIMWSSVPNALHY